MPRNGALLALFSTALALGAGAPPSLAHHSQAMYDPSVRISLTGTVKAFAWGNPHVRLMLLVPDGEGGAVEWALEGSAVAQLRSRGWRGDSLAPGETVTAVVHPLKSGQPAGAFIRVMRADGAVVGAVPATRR